MKIIENEIERQLKEYSEALAAADKVLKSPLPPEKLHCAKNKGTWQYYTISGEKGGKRVYLPSSRRNVASAIAQRDYASLVKKRVRSWQKKLKKAQKLLQETWSVSEIPQLAHMSMGRQLLIKPFQLTAAQYADLWNKQPFKQKEMKQGTTTYLTDKGDLVRSKSEKIMADWFYAHHIPYRYEQQLRLSSSLVVHPDFTVLNVRKRKVLYIEHFGMMDDPHYADTAVSKVNSYILAGYTIGEDFIYISETKDHPLQTSVFNKVFASLIPPE